jgi:hypothetical protein
MFGLDWIGLDWIGLFLCVRVAAVVAVVAVKAFREIEHHVLHDVINVAFVRVHDVFQFVEKVVRDEIGMPPNDVIRVRFYHVFAVQVAPMAHAFEPVAHVRDAGAFF